MNRELLVLQGDGALWGVSAAVVAAVEARPGGVRLRLRGGRAVDGDEVVGLAVDVVVRPSSAAVRSRLPRATSGLALWEGRPVLVLEDAGAAPEGRA